MANELACSDVSVLQDQFCLWNFPLVDMTLEKSRSGTFALLGDRIRISGFDDTEEASAFGLLTARRN